MFRQRTIPRITHCIQWHSNPKQQVPSHTHYHWAMPRTGGSVVSVSDSWPVGCEFDPRLRRLFFPAYFRLLPLQKHVRKVIGRFGKKSVSTGVRKPGNTCASPTVMIWPYLLKWRQTPIQPTNQLQLSIARPLRCIAKSNVNNTV